MTIDKELFTKIKEAFESAELEVESYSGRGMYGKHCLGCVCNNAVEAVIDVVQALLENNSEVEVEIYEILKALRGSKTDSMGRDMIVYWPNITWFEDEESAEEEPVIVDVNTDEYERAHGKLPRGDGNWAFYFGIDRESPKFFNGKYSEARKQAAQIAFAEGFESITVGS